MKHVPSISFSEDSLSNKNILITGAGSGIGRAVAKIAAKNQANLILLSKDCLLYTSPSPRDRH